MKITVQPGQEYFKVDGLLPGQVVQVLAGNTAGEAVPTVYTAPAPTAAPVAAIVGED